jgi:hypothetical protein
LSYFKINSFQEMEELKRMGSKWLYYKLNAAQYNDILQIRDLIECSFDHIVVIEGKEYETIASSTLLP